MLLGCGGRTEGSDDDLKIQHPQTVTPPWHLWGQESTLQVVTNSATPVVNQSAQLARVKYNRPDSWRFLFTATLESLVDPVPAGAFIFVDFALQIGVGLTVKKIERFCRFTFDPPYTLPDRRWTGAGLEPSRGVGAPAQRFIDVITAEAIQCDATVSVQAGSGAGSTAVINLSAFFAPATHIRPDWYGHAEFPGGERQGR